MNLLKIAVLSSLLLANAAPKAGRHQSGEVGGSKQSVIASLPLSGQGNSLALTDQIQTRQTQAESTSVRIVSVPDKSRSDRVIFVVNILLAIVGIAGVCVAVCTLSYIRTQATHMVESERPFLMIEVSGDANAAIFQNLQQRPLSREGTLLGSSSSANHSATWPKAACNP
jgi:hypothetical protein